MILWHVWILAMVSYCNLCLICSPLCNQLNVCPPVQLLKCGQNGSDPSGAECYGRTHYLADSFLDHSVFVGGTSFLTTMPTYSSNNLSHQALVAFPKLTGVSEQGHDRTFLEWTWFAVLHYRDWVNVWVLGIFHVVAAETIGYWGGDNSLSMFGLPQMFGMAMHLFGSTAATNGTLIDYDHILPLF